MKFKAFIWGIVSLISILGVYGLFQNAGSSDRVVPSNLSIGAIYPRISPDGSEAAVSYQGSIWRVSLETREMVQLTNGEGFDIQPAWSPDGKQVAFLRTSGFYGGDLRIIEASTAEERELPRPVSGRGKLYFHPDGRRILGNFRSHQDDGFVIGWYELDSGEVNSLSPSPGWRQSFALSHSGNWVVAATDQDQSGHQGGNFGPYTDLWQWPSGGGEPLQLTRFPARIYDLSWRPDDRALYLVTDLGGAHYDIWELPLDDPDGGRRQLTFGKGDEDSPSVTSSGTRLLYTDNRYGATSLVVRDLRSGQEEWLEMSALQFSEPTGTLQLSVTEASTGRHIEARLIISSEQGQYYAPPGSLYRYIANDLQFYLDRTARFELPAGTYRAKVQRGPEYLVEEIDFTIQPGELRDLAVRLKRWTNQKAQDWYSGESHIHANYGYGHWYNSPKTARLQGAGEDLIVCNFMVANSDGDGVFDREFFLGYPDPRSTEDTILYWNQEFRSTIWGHMTLLNLTWLVEPIFTGFPHTTNPHDHPTNAMIADHVHDQGGHVNYTHPAHNVKDPYLSAYSAKELPIDVALGKIDSIDVMGSNHEANMPLWYRLLNCGFRIPASAGTDCFLNRIPGRVPGEDRVYVKVDGEFNYQNWIKNLKQGRTFVTNGPVLEFAVEGAMAGSTVELSEPGAVQVAGSVTSQFPVERVELIFNGAVVDQIQTDGDRQTVHLDRNVSIPEAGWLAVRAYGPPNPAQGGRPFFCHSGPVYLEVAGQTTASAEDASYFLDWIDRLWGEIEQRDRILPRHRAEVEAQVEQARNVYRSLAN